MSEQTKQLEYNLFVGNLAEFVNWWNKQSADKYNGATQIIHIKEFIKQPDPVCVEYILQKVR